ncbi:MAG TPA: Maf family protein [Candidatus Binatia bacterium]
MRLILASTSPRRREIFALLGLPFDVVEPVFEERVSVDLPIRDEVLAFAVGKARSVVRDHPYAIVIGSDTMIALGGEKFGKPRDRNDARRMLHAFSGKTHEIFTGLAIIDGLGGAGLEIVEQVDVDMRRLSEADIDSYLACDESMDKAGAYSIQGQGAELITAIRGDYLAAVGMPLKAIADYLTGSGVSLSLNVGQLYRDKSYLNWQRF